MEFSRSPLFVAVKTQTSQSSKKSPASINRCSSLLHRSPSGVPPASQSQMFRAPNSASPGSKAITGVRSVVDGEFEKPAQDLEGSTEEWLGQNPWAWLFLQFRSLVPQSPLCEPRCSPGSLQGPVASANS
ncbi:hypothetical protein IHE44_0007065 [Lamprotornis superbus]|uniref:Uncharacterized protein n=1 Tax=Lamprotornis superbus TaxID=245042 RepID=A0A835TTA4_9PASS|nr:hypothetical protein IHE44_0007065 [Lamprotornis superbus]